MSAVMLSINPKWCELIANGIKTVEVRKTRPKIETPFKCYIYQIGKKSLLDTAYHGETFCPKNGYVIGEFVCNEIFPIRVFENGTIQDYMFHGMEKSCVPYDNIANYIGNGCIGYGWHISDLKIYDKPRELREFKKAGFMTEDDWLAALYPNTHCHYEAWAKRFEVTRPPQSWCYVEELQG